MPLVIFASFTLSCKKSSESTQSSGAFGAPGIGPTTSPSSSSRPSHTQAPAYQAITGDETTGERRRWDALFGSSEKDIFGKEPSAFLKAHVDLLPKGRVLDIAMGEGRNAVYLAKLGFAVEGVDISEVALRKARRLAKELGVEVHTINADLNRYKIHPNSYDVILNINYLQRSLFGEIKKGLRKGGVLVFENLTVDQLKLPQGQSQRRDFLLEDGELKRVFTAEEFDFRVYEETNDGKEAVAKLIAIRK